MNQTSCVSSSWTHKRHLRLCLKNKNKKNIPKLSFWWIAGGFGPLDLHFAPFSFGEIMQPEVSHHNGHLWGPREDMVEEITLPPRPPPLPPLWWGRGRIWGSCGGTEGGCGAGVDCSALLLRCGLHLGTAEGCSWPLPSPDDSTTQRCVGNVPALNTHKQVKYYLKSTNDVSDFKFHYVS